MTPRRRLVVGITGASGSIYGIRLLERLRDTDVESHLVLSRWGARTLVHETGYTVEQVQRLATVVYPSTDQGAAISSGSFLTLGMVVLPCSMKTLGQIATCTGERLIPRAADVVLEGAAPARARRARVAAARDPPAAHAHADADGRHHRAAAAGVLQPAAHGGRDRGSHGDPRSSTSSRSRRRRAPLGRRDGRARPQCPTRRRCEAAWARRCRSRTSSPASSSRGCRSPAPAEVDAAVLRAQAAFPAWRDTPAHRRSAILSEDRGADRRAQRARSPRRIAREAGKAWKHAANEVARSVETFTFAAEEATRIHGETVPMDASTFGEGRVGFYLRSPLGVVSAITPFNFPLNLVAHKVGPALAAGNTIVLKPAEETPLTAVAMADCLREAGLPDGVLELVHGDGPITGEALVKHPVPAKISFTGSPPVGAHILQERRSQARHAGTGQQLRHHRRARRQPRSSPCRDA